MESHLGTDGFVCIFYCVYNCQQTAHLHGLLDNIHGLLEKSVGMLCYYTVLVRGATQMMPGLSSFG